MKEVNKSIPKIDGMGLVTGKPAFTDDLAPADALVVKILRSPHAFARIKSIRTDGALELPGVVCVLTWRDVPRVVITRAGQGYPEPSPRDRFTLDEFVRHVGDDVAVVGAESEEAAAAAIRAIDVDYEVLDPVLDFEAAEGHPSVLHPETEAREMFPIGFDPNRNIASAYEMHVGDVDAVVDQADIVLKRRFYTQAQAHVALEPHSVATWLDLNDRLNVLTSTQTPFHVRRIMADALERPLHGIRVIKPRVGGGFGGKQQVTGELFAALVTLRTGRPAKLVYTRQEVFTSTCCRHAMRLDVTLAAERNGRLQAIDMRILSDTGAYGEHALTTFMVAGAKTLPLYNRVDAVRFGGKTVYTNLPTAGAYRGYGAIQGNFALESTLNELAIELSLDPAELRRINMIREGETSPVFAIMGEGTEGVAMNVGSCKLDYCLDRALEMIGWQNKARRRVVDSGRVRGLGLAVAMQGSGVPTIDMAAATLKLNDQGSFNLLVGATDLGTGSDTILAQMVADVLGVSTEQIIVTSSDTDQTPFDTGAYASSTTYVSGNAVVKTARAMRELIVGVGAERLASSADDVEFDGRTIRSRTGESISLSDLSTELFYSRNQQQLAVTESYLCEQSPPPYMAGLAEVEVDLQTGEFTLEDFVAVVDCGTTINPNLARVQVEGGLVQGIGMAMFEDVRVSPQGRLRTADLINYRIPSRMDIPDLRVEFAESSEPTGPFGAKSVGEIGIDTPPAAIASAVHAATGVWVRDLPITPEKILRALMVVP